MKNYIFCMLFLLFASCNTFESNKQVSEIDITVGKTETIFAANGVQPVLEKKLLSIFKEESFGGWPVYMVFLYQQDSLDYIFIVGSLSYLPNDIIGGFVYDDILITFYSQSINAESFCDIINIEEIGGLTKEVYKHYRGDTDAPWPIFHETFHKFEIRGDTLLFLSKGRLKDEIPFYDFSTVREMQN